MLKINKINKNTDVANYISNNFENYFSLCDENKTIGFAGYENRLKKPIEVFILEKYRGNGFGTHLFKEMLQIAKKENVKEIKLIIDNENFIANRIVLNAQAIKVSTVNGKSIYVLPILKNSYID